MGPVELLFPSFQTGQLFLGLLMSLSDILLTGLPFFLGKGNLAKIENIFGTKGKKEIEMEIRSTQKQQMKKNMCMPKCENRQSKKKWDSRFDSYLKNGRRYESENLI